MKGVILDGVDSADAPSSNFAGWIAFGCHDTRERR